MTSITKGEIPDTDQFDPEHLEALRALVHADEMAKWDAGDLVLALVPENTNGGSPVRTRLLSALAEQLGTEQALLSDWRRVAAAFHVDPKHPNNWGWRSAASWSAHRALAARSDRFDLMESLVRDGGRITVAAAKEAARAADQEHSNQHHQRRQQVAEARHGSPVEAAEAVLAGAELPPAVSEEEIRSGQREEAISRAAREESRSTMERWDDLEQEMLALLDQADLASLTTREAIVQGLRDLADLAEVRLSQPDDDGSTATATPGSKLPPIIPVEEGPPPVDIVDRQRYREVAELDALLALTCSACDGHHPAEDDCQPSSAGEAPKQQKQKTYLCERCGVDLKSVGVKVLTPGGTVRRFCRPDCPGPVCSDCGQAGELVDGIHANEDECAL